MHPLVIVAPPFAVIEPLDVKVPLIAVFPVIDKASAPGLVYDPTASLVMALYVSPTAKQGNPAYMKTRHSTPSICGSTIKSYISNIGVTFKKN